MERITKFKIININKVASCLQVKASNGLRFISESFLIGLHINKLFAVDGAVSAPFHQGHWATTETGRYVKKEID
jgi:hypothetical protein